MRQFLSVSSFSLRILYLSVFMTAHCEFWFGNQARLSATEINLVEWRDFCWSCGKQESLYNFISQRTMVVIDEFWSWINDWIFYQWNIFTTYVSISYEESRRHNYLYRQWEHYKNTQKLCDVVYRNYLQNSINVFLCPYLLWMIDLLGKLSFYSSLSLNLPERLVKFSLTMYLNLSMKFSEDCQKSIHEIFAKSSRNVRTNPVPQIFTKFFSNTGNCNSLVLLKLELEMEFHSPRKFPTNQKITRRTCPGRAKYFGVEETRNCSQ